MLLVPCALSGLLHAVAPPHLPNIWGGAAFGNVMKNSGQIFAFSGADGETHEGSGFAGLLLPQIDNQTLGVQFLGGDAILQLGFSQHQLNQPTLLVVSSDVFVANSSGSANAAEQIVLAYKQWNVLVGRAPAHSLTQRFAMSSSQSPVCNISGTWETDSKVYTIIEDSDGIFSAHAKHPRSWRTASGHVLANGSISIVFDNRFQDTATLTSLCDRIKWASGHGEWIRLTPTPAGCSQIGQMALCAANNSQTFAAAYGSDAVDLASKTLEELNTHGVDDIVAARQAPFRTIPEPLMKSTKYDFARLANKVYSVMRVNTLSPEGIVPVHWSTPDKVCYLESV